MVLASEQLDWKAHNCRHLAELLAWPPVSVDPPTRCLVQLVWALGSCHRAIHCSCNYAAPHARQQLLLRLVWDTGWWRQRSWCSRTEARVQYLLCKRHVPHYLLQPFACEMVMQLASLQHSVAALQLTSEKSDAPEPRAPLQWLGQVATELAAADPAWQQVAWQSVQLPQHLQGQVAQANMRLCCFPFHCALHALQQHEAWRGDCRPLWGAVKKLLTLIALDSSPWLP